MKPRSTLKVTLVGCSLILLLTGCSARKPEPLSRAENKLREAKEDTFVLTNAPVTLSHAERTLNEAQDIWRETRDSDKVVPLARIAEDQIDNARVLARKGAALDSAKDAAQQSALLRKETELRIAENRVDSANRTNTILLSELKDLSDKNAREKFMVSLDSDVLFDVDQSTLRSGAQRQLDPVAQFLRLNSNHTIVIEGHADNMGSAAYNQDLSARRADAVRDQLASDGISRSRIIARGLGESFPRVSNSSNAGRLQNRRVDITISPAA